MNTPWYKQFWPWFLIALPLSAIIASLSTVFLFSRHQVSLVTEDYYQKGKAINLDLTRLAKADELNISAKMKVKGNQVLITLNKGHLEYFPALEVIFQHRTLENKDIFKMVTPDATGQYRISLDNPLLGPWYIEINTFDRLWALNNRAHFPQSDSISLYGKKKG